VHLIDAWFDPVSPYAALAFHRLPEALEGLSVSVTWRPVLFAGLLKHWGQLGPAEIGPKREWTYRQVLWLARTQGVALRMPAHHPFNPLPLLRLALACATPVDQPLSPAAGACVGATPNRWVVEAILDHVWRDGGDPLDRDRLAELTARLAPTRDPAGDEVRQALRASTDAAIAAGVFGVPTFSVGGRHFWGLDALPMLAQALRGDPWFDGPGWHAVGDVGIGVTRSR
jgi:2-hydroxychromene-2-carboxylate isomerase